MRRWTTLAVLLSATFLANLDIFAVVVAMPSLRRELGAGAGALQLVLACYQLTYALGLVAGGRLGDSSGPFRVFGAGMVLFTLASACCGIAPTTEALVVARALQGAGTALMVPQVFRVARTLFAGRARSRAFAAVGAAMGLGAVSGQLLGGALIAADPFGLGWRAVFLVNLPIGVVALVALRWSAAGADGRGPARVRADSPGALLAAAALGLFVVPLVLGREQGYPWWVPAALIASAPIAVAFFRHESAVQRRGGDPLVPPPLLRTPGFRRGLALVGLVNCGLGSFVLTLGLLLQDGLGWSPIATGLGMLPPAGAFACASLFAPRLGDSGGLRPAALLSTAGYAGCALSALLGGTGWLLVALAVTGAGLGLFVTPALSLALRGVPERWSGAASGVVATVQQLGAALGVCVFGLLFFSLAGNGPAGYPSAFAITSLVTAAAALSGGALAPRSAASRSGDVRAAGVEGLSDGAPNPMPTAEPREATMSTSLLPDAHQRPEDRITALYPGVQEHLRALLDHYRPQHPRLHGALERLLARGRKDPQEFALPLLVHAAITGVPGPAMPIAGVHALWWRAANTFDDVVDRDAVGRLYGLSSGVALTAALECGHALPLRALSTMDVPDPLRRRLVDDYFGGWTDAIDGQIGDVLSSPAEADPAGVMATYAHKSGAIYAMTCTMAARLALGTDRAEVEGWGRFGQLLGLLAQFRNDGDDLRSGRHEDLRNGTATYLLVHLLHTGSSADRERGLALLAEAATSHRSRQELADLMRQPAIMQPYQERLGAIADEARALLVELAPSSPFIEPLRERIDAEVLPAVPESSGGSPGRAASR